MFKHHRRSRSLGNTNATTTTTKNGVTGPTTPLTTTGSPLLMWRRKQHRRCQSAGDATVATAKAAAVANASTIPEEEECWQLKKTDIHVGKLLGEGGFAQVFAVTLKTSKKTTKQKLALKQLRPDLLQDKTLFGRAADALVQEAKIMTLLKGHDHILNLRGVSTDTTAPVATKRGFDSFFLVTDVLRETMADRLKKWQASPCTPERWRHQLQYSLQLAKALAYCHEHNVVYRDAKADNLGFSDEHTLQLYDFGLARQLPQCDSEEEDAQTCTSSLDDSITASGEDVFCMTICGTQRYMAPEVFNKGWYNCKADSYSWAMTVVELMTLKKPCSYMSLPVHKILVLEGGGRPSLEGFPKGLQAILQQAWANRLADRWSMAQVVAALEAYIGSECSQQQQQQVDTKKAPVLQDQARANNLTAVKQTTTAAGAGPALASAA